MLKDGLLKGKRILVTGGGTGLGREMASSTPSSAPTCTCAAAARTWSRKPPVRSRKQHGVKVRADGARHPQRRSGGQLHPVHLGRRRAARRPDEQRRWQLHQPHRGSLAPRLRRGRQYRHARHLLCHAQRRQALGAEARRRSRRWASRRCAAWCRSSSPGSSMAVPSSCPRQWPSRRSPT